MDESAYGYWLPPVASAHGPAIDHLLLLLHIFMAVIFLGWSAFFIFCLIKFRARKNHSAQHALPRASFVKYAELGIVAIELLLLFGVSTPIWWNYLKPPESDPNALHIRVVAEQYAWNIRYAGRDGKFGKASIDAMSADNPLGLDADDADGKDDIVTINQLHLPAGRSVVIDLTAKDVIHGFNIPALRVKHDAVPGQLSSIWFTPTRPGHYELACAQLCGLGHYRMRGDVFIDTPEEFDKWVVDNSPAPAAPEQR